MLSAFALLPAAAQQTKTDRLVDSAAQKDAPGIAVMVRQNGYTTYQRGYGVRDLRSRGPITNMTNFRLASVTKQFTAMAIMLLIHDKNLSYETTLAQIFPDFPEYGKKITIRNLLNHTSGLPDYEDLMERSGKTWTADHQISDAEVFKLLQQAKSAKFAPGTSWSYSNSGYVLLGVIVAKISGKPFEQFLGDRIFTPLKMDHTVAYVKGENSVPERAYGHVRENGKVIPRDQSSTSATLGDGGVYSNLEDLAKWDDALTNHTLLIQAEFAPALEAFRLPSGSWPKWSSDPGDTSPLEGAPVMYGFGWFLNPYKDQRRMWHYGDTTGFQTAIQRFLDDKLTIVVLSNRADIDSTKIAEQIADMYLKH
jgi:CubicO group peptidase (beta-lactamase class C family)